MNFKLSLEAQTRISEYLATTPRKTFTDEQKLEILERTIKTFTTREQLAILEKGLRS